MIDRCRSLLVSSLSYYVFILFLVLMILCFCLLMCSLSVAGAESGKYCWTGRAVNPGQVEFL